VAQAPASTTNAAFGRPVALLGGGVACVERGGVVDGSRGRGEGARCTTMTERLWAWLLDDGG
jgi:hypothetical protein